MSHASINERLASIIFGMSTCSLLAAKTAPLILHFSGLFGLMFLMRSKVTTVLSSSGERPFDSYTCWIHSHFPTRAAPKQNYLQGCKHTLCLGDICLGNWVKWRGRLLVPSPMFRTDREALLQNCFSLKQAAKWQKNRGETLTCGGRRRAASQFEITCGTFPCCSRQPK